MCGLFLQIENVLSDDLTLRVGERTLSGWLSIRVTRGIGPLVERLRTGNDRAVSGRRPPAECAVSGKEISIAGDQGREFTFKVLRAMRVAASRDLAARGADLVSITEVATDPVACAGIRADEVVAQTDPVHPPFMPGRFNTLSKQAVSVPLVPGMVGVGIGRVDTREYHLSPLLNNGSPFVQFRQM